MVKRSRLLAITALSALLALVLHVHPVTEGSQIGLDGRHCALCASTGGGQGVEAAALPDLPLLWKALAILLPDESLARPGYSLRCAIRGPPRSFFS